MATHSLQQADNGFYYVHWIEGRRTKRVSTRTKDLVAAKAFLAQWLTLDASATPASALPVADLWAAYDAKHIQREAASTATASQSWARLAPHFGALTPRQITQDVVDAYVEKRVSGALGRASKPQTARRELVALRACLNWCADPKRRLLDPADLPLFDLPPEGAPRDRWLRQDEIKRLLDAAATLRGGERLSRGERFLWLALETAGRKQALLDLTWDRVDFETGVIHLADPSRRETKKRRASVPMSKALRPVLERAYAERTGPLVLDNKGEVWATVQIIAEAAGFGSSPAPRSAGQKPKATGVSPHVLRHTAATHMARRGVPLWKIAKVLGNTLAMVEKVYAKHAPDDLREAVDRITGIGD